MAAPDHELGEFAYRHVTGPDGSEYRLQTGSTVSGPVIIGTDSRIFTSGIGGLLNKLLVRLQPASTVSANVAVFLDHDHERGPIHIVEVEDLITARLRMNEIADQIAAGDFTFDGP
ncbi:MAG: hypothetical protein HZY75_09630 [Nocardioidaceae bacterium]|nr:MAG: hypothetical protein HZY75_09630 [Nocardioidaceae bacterium]